jgi:hypothetical protein
MGDFNAGALTSAGSTTLPIGSLYGGGAAAALTRILEIEIWNTSTTTAVALRLVRLTTTGTRGSALTTGTKGAHNPEAATAIAYQTHTVAPTLVEQGKRCFLLAGAGVIWTFADWEFTIPATANAGVGITVENGTGQACMLNWGWKE